ncbi:MAG: pyruvoyl-dependent arginine decarboxylase [Candidatus Aenigmatarchaeota archaeon]
MNKNSQKLLLKEGTTQELEIVTSNRIPKDFFITTGVGESDITVHAGSYHLALKEAGIERCNIMVYSSILPGIATEIQKPPQDKLVHGSVLESIMANATGNKGERVTAGVIFGWLFDKNTGKKYGGLVCEYHGSGKEEECVDSLKASLREMYENGYSDQFGMKDIRVVTKSFVPKKKFGSALVALCFVNYVFPVIGITGQN